MPVLSRTPRLPKSSASPPSSSTAPVSYFVVGSYLIVLVWHSFCLSICAVTLKKDRQATAQTTRLSTATGKDKNNNNNNNNLREQHQYQQLHRTTAQADNLIVNKELRKGKKREQQRRQPSTKEATNKLIFTHSGSFLTTSNTLSYIYDNSAGGGCDQVGYQRLQAQARCCHRIGLNDLQRFSWKKEAQKISPTEVAR